MNIIVVGTNHKYSPVKIREKLFFSASKLSQSLSRLLIYNGVRANLILSTCNRVELYASTQNISVGILSLKRFLSDFHHLDLPEIESYLYTFTDKEAILHLFQVTSGLDSQIIGENQILEQVKFSYQQAMKNASVDKLLDTIFGQAIKTAQKVKQKTEISQGKISLGSIIVEFIKQQTGMLEEKNLLVIGIGKISELVIKYLKDEKVKTVFVANRTYEKALELARIIGADVVRFDKLTEKLKEADIVISATASSHLILKKEDMTDINKPLLIIDLAVPRDVAPEIKNIRGISLFSLDDLDFIIEKNIQKRKQEIPKAMDIINQEVDRLCLKGYPELELAPVLSP